MNLNCLYSKERTVCESTTLGFLQEWANLCAQMVVSAFPGSWCSATLGVCPASMAASSIWGSDLQYWWQSYWVSLHVPGDSRMGSILLLLPPLPVVLWELGNRGSKRLIEVQIHDTFPRGCNSQADGCCGDAAVCGVTQASLINPSPVFCNRAQQTHWSRHTRLR